MTWKPIADAPQDGTPVLAAMQSATNPWYFPYPMKSRLIDGKWCADFGKDDWRPYEPQPTHYLHTAPAGEPSLRNVPACVGRYPQQRILAASSTPHLASYLHA